MEVCTEVCTRVAAATVLGQLQDDVVDQVGDGVLGLVLGEFDKGRVGRKVSPRQLVIQYLLHVAGHDAGGAAKLDNLELFELAEVILRADGDGLLGKLARDRRVERQQVAGQD